MKQRIYFAAILALMGVAMFAGGVAAQNTANWMAQGGARWVIGGSLDVASGGDLDIESGGSLKIAGTAVSATATELNQIADSSGRIVNATAATLAVSEATPRQARLISFWSRG